MAVLAPEAMQQEDDEEEETLGALESTSGRAGILDVSNLSQQLQASFKTGVDGWRTYLRQPIVPSSLTYVILFFNVALSPGGLITAFLASWGMDGTAMALFKSGCAGVALPLLGRLLLIY